MQPSSSSCFLALLGFLFFFKNKLLLPAPSLEEVAVILNWVSESVINRNLCMGHRWEVIKVGRGGGGNLGWKITSRVTDSQRIGGDILQQTSDPGR